jgi:AcrR family transcriptional regulator
MKTLPRTERGRRTRAAIVEAAARLMHERGLAAPSMDDVLLASGTGKSQLYHYFAGKRELTVAVLLHQFEQALDVQPALTDPTCDDLRRWRDDVVRTHREKDNGICPLGVFIGQVDSDPVLRATLVDLFARWHAAIADLVDRAARAGRLHPDTDPAAAGWALLTALQGGTMLAHLRGDEGPLVQALDAVVDGLVEVRSGRAEDSPARGR